MLKGTLEESKEAATDDEEEEYISKISRLWQCETLIKKGECKEAINLCNEVLEEDPEFGDAYGQRGLAKHKLGNYEGAIKDYSRAIEFGADPTFVLHNRAEARIQANKFKKAEQDAAKIKEESESIEHIASGTLLRLISRIATGEDITGEEEDEYRDFCEKEFSTAWEFEEIDSWIKDSNLGSEKKVKIEELVDLLREHKDKSN